MLLPNGFRIDSSSLETNMLVQLKNNTDARLSIAYVAKNHLSTKTIEKTLDTFLPDHTTFSLNHFTFEHYLRESNQSAMLIIGQRNS